MYSKEQFFCSRVHNRVLVEHDHRMFLVVCILKELSFHTPNRPFFRLNIQLHLKRYNETRISFRQMMIFLLLFLLLLIYLRIYIPWGMRWMSSFSKSLIKSLTDWNSFFLLLRTSNNNLFCFVVYEAIIVLLSFLLLYENLYQALNIIINERQKWMEN